MMPYPEAILGEFHHYACINGRADSVFSHGWAGWFALGRRCRAGVAINCSVVK
jgi:hypothetical protein